MQSSVHIEQIPVGPMANFSYLIVDLQAQKACYVDPGWEVAKIASFAREKNWSIEKILLTHTHFDHCQSLEEASDTFKVPVYVHPLEKERVAKMSVSFAELSDNQIIECGGLKIKCLLTPGHSPGEICFWVENHLISGDVLFVEGCGRVDLPDSDPAAMYETLRRLGELPDNIIIYPGHDYGPSPTDTLGYQKKTNPYLASALRGQGEFFGVRGVI